MRYAESDVVRLMGKGRVELKLGVGSAEDTMVDWMTFGLGEGDFGESMIKVEFTVGSIDGLLLQTDI